MDKASFMKIYHEIWAEEMFIIDPVVYDNPTTYKTCKIKDQDNEPIKGIFYEQILFEYACNGC